MLKNFSLLIPFYFILHLHYFQHVIFILTNYMYLTSSYIRRAGRMMTNTVRDIFLTRTKAGFLKKHRLPRKTDAPVVSYSPLWTG